MKLTWSHRARRDLRELIAFIAEDRVQAAEVVADRILKAAELLTEFPRSGRIGRVPETRERVVDRTPYILAYRIVSGRIRILRVYHSARRWPAQF
jgi:addiction module RelE/StbE family toxin